MGLAPQTRHGNALVRGYALAERPFAAFWPLQLVLDGSLGPLCRPNTDTFNAVMEVLAFAPHCSACAATD